MNLKKKIIKKIITLGVFALIITLNSSCNSQTKISTTNDKANKIDELVSLYSEYPKEKGIVVSIKKI